MMLIPLGVSESAESQLVPEAQHNHALALSLSKGGRGLQACFDKLSTGLEDWAGTVCNSGSILFQPQRHKP